MSSTKYHGILTDFDDRGSSDLVLRQDYFIILPLAGKYRIIKINLTMPLHQRLEFHPTIHVLLVVVNPVLNRCQDLLVALFGICFTIIVQKLRKRIVKAIPSLLTIR